MSVVGKNIKKYRKERELTQKQLGELCKINEVQIRKYEIGKATPKFETLIKISKGLDVTLFDLIDTSSYSKEIMNTSIKNSASNIKEYIEDSVNSGFLTFEEICEESNISELKMNNYINNTDSPTFFELYKLSQILDIEVFELMSKKDINDIFGNSGYLYLFGIEFDSSLNGDSLNKTFNDLSLKESKEKYLSTYFDINEITTIELFNQLNDNGKDKAIEYLEMLSKLDDYKL